MPAPQPAPSSHHLALVAEALACLRFYTRLPFPSFAAEASHPPLPFARALAWAPLAGSVVGLFGAGTLLAADALALPPLPGAALGLLATVAVGGGLHEDGLADVADGFGGGATRERKLAIMRDSHLGTYGVLALAFSLLLRVASLAALDEQRGASFAAVALVAAAAASRGFGLMPMARLPPARTDGLGAAAGPLPRHVYPQAAALSVVLGVGLPALAGGRLLPSLGALGLAALAATGMTWLARRQIGGFTGDVAGACQQLCEIALLIGLLIGMPAR